MHAALSSDDTPAEPFRQGVVSERGALLDRGQRGDVACFAIERVRGPSLDAHVQATNP